MWYLMMVPLIRVRAKMPCLSLWLIRNSEQSSHSPDRVVTKRRAATDGCHAVVLAHLKYVPTLNLWYCICQPYDLAIHRITHNITFRFSVKRPLVTFMVSFYLYSV